MVAGHLIAAKGRVGTTEGILPAAELILSLFTQCPGLLRCEREGRRWKGKNRNFVAAHISAELSPE